MRIVRKLGVLAGLLVGAVSSVAFGQTADETASPTATAAPARDTADQAIALTKAQMGKVVAGHSGSTSCGGGGGSYSPPRHHH